MTSLNQPISPVSMQFLNSFTPMTSQGNQNTSKNLARQGSNNNLLNKMAALPSKTKFKTLSVVLKDNQTINITLLQTSTVLEFFQKVLQEIEGKGLKNQQNLIGLRTFEC